MLRTAFFSCKDQRTTDLTEDRYAHRDHSVHGELNATCYIPKDSELHKVFLHEIPSKIHGNFFEMTNLKNSELFH